ncbi:hypothetical protein AB0F72_32070 [Actinoplanes sp. NPDC023936]|uniref:hypothetical protein n=1 Tax=Actinoplanes sp. NPDC023936 TaxID=3154910 RepID=UPI0033CC1D94
MARRVFLHVGAPKTGSTYVQNVLWNNADALKSAGILLPGGSWAQDQAMTDLREVEWRDPRASWTWARLAEEIRKWDGDAIVSNEALGGATPAQAARGVAAFAPAEVHVIVSGRDLWRTFPSMWQQSVRARNKWSFTEFLTAVEQGRFETFWEMHTPNRMLRKWGDLVPAERRHLITVPGPGAPRDTLWHRFAGVTGIPDGVCDLEDPTANPSLGAAEIEVLRRVNAALGDRFPHRTPYQLVVQRHLVNAVLKNGRNDVRFGVGLDRAGWVAEMAEQQIAELRDYPCHVVGDLDELRPANMTETSSPDDLDDSRILATAIETIVGMLEHADALSRQPNADGIRALSLLKDRAAIRLRRTLKRVSSAKR